MGIEPTYPAWKAGVLPLNYTCISYQYSFVSIGVTGFEPATSWSQTRRSSQAEPHPVMLCVSFFCLTRYLLYISCFGLSSTFFTFFNNFFICAFLYLAYRLQRVVSYHCFFHLSTLFFKNLKQFEKFKKFTFKRAGSHNVGSGFTDTGSHSVPFLLRQSPSRCNLVCALPVLDRTDCLD